MWGPSWALWDVWQHPCPLPTGCQYPSPPPAVIIKTLHMLINVPGRPNCPVENHCSSLSCSPSGFLLILPEPFQIPSCPGSLRSSSPETPVSLKQSPTPTRKALRTQFTHCSPPRLCGDATLCTFGSLAQGLALQRSLLSRFFSFKQKLDLILGVMPHSLQDLRSSTRD